ncbi:potassium channel family protein [Pseudomonadota bacterium]
MKDKILLFGIDELGLDVAAQLQGKGRDLLLVAEDEPSLALAAAKGFKTAHIDYQDDESLRTLGIGSDVGLIFCLLPKDSKNVFLTISARALDAEIVIVSLTQSGDSVHALKAAGADKVIDPYEISGRKIYDLIQKPLIAETLEHTVFGQQDLNLAEVVVMAGSTLDGRTLASIEISQCYNLVLLGVVDREREDNSIFAVGSNSYRLDSGDVLIVIGPEQAIAKFKQDAEQPA